MNLGERVNMRVLMVMFDSLNRDMLEPYGGNLVKTPNFTRMAEHSVTFDNCYAYGKIQFSSQKLGAIGTV